MRILIYLCLLFVNVLRFLPHAHATGTNYYVAPNGSGSTCTTQSPCSLNTGFTKAQAGDEVVLRNGLYVLSNPLVLTRAGITVRAENTHQAIIRMVSGINSQLIFIQGDDITMRGLRIEAEQQFVSTTNARGVKIQVAQRAFFEHNIITQGAFWFGCDVHNVVVRHNRFENSQEEQMYLRCTVDGSGVDRITNNQIYGNTLVASTKSMDVKEGRGYDIHHNIIEGLDGVGPDPAIGAGEACVTLTSQVYDSRFHDNIIRNSVCGSNPAYPTVDYISPWRNNLIDKNVLYNLTGPAAVWHYASASQSAAATVIQNNTWCGVPSTLICERGAFNCVANSKSIAGLSVTVTSSPATACDAEVNRILSEMNNLPGAQEGPTQPPQQLKPAVLGFIGN
jgi:hypothetical protein